MTLRLRLFLLLGALVALLVAGQAVLMRSLTRDLAEEVGDIVVSVGESVAAAVGEEPLHLPPAADGDLREHKIKVIHLPRIEGEIERDLAYEVHEQKQTVEVEGAAEPQVRRTELRVKLVSRGGERTLVLDDGGGAARAIAVPEHGVSREVGRFRRRLLLGSLGLLAVGLIAAGAVAHRVSRPLAELTAAARRVGEGALGTQAPEPRDREVGSAVAAFNRMSRELARLDEDARAFRAREHLAELGEVARGLAHSLRNPLHALGLTVGEMAAMTPAPTAASPGGESVADLAEGARRQIQRIDRSLRSLLVLAADGGPAREPVDLPALAADVALEVLQDFRGRVRIEVEAPAEGEPLTLLGVAAELRAMLQALVVNAAEASPEGGQVRLRLAASPAGATIEVLDRGEGLPAEVRARLFSPHVTTKPTGSGMGLFLCHRLATTRYGGDLTLEDREGGGSRAVLALSRRQAAGEPAPDA